MVRDWVRVVEYRVRFRAAPLNGIFDAATGKKPSSTLECILKSPRVFLPSTQSSDFYWKKLSN